MGHYNWQLPSPLAVPMPWMRVRVRVVWSECQTLRVTRESVQDSYLQESQCKIQTSDVCIQSMKHLSVCSDSFGKEKAALGIWAGMAMVAVTGISRHRSLTHTPPTLPPPYVCFLLASRGLGRAASLSCACCV